MKIFSLGILGLLMSLSSIAAPPKYYTALTDAPPFVAMLTQSGADLVAITNTDYGTCQGCYGFEVDVIFPDGSDDTWYFITELAPAGIVVTFLPDGPPSWDMASTTTPSEDK